jgi:hypothetical protein
MCLLVVMYRIVDDAAVIVAANREEAYARPGTPPQRVANGVRFLAGLDPQAGGTWLGVNAHGVLVAVTNRPKSQVPARPRSRGLLVRDLLQCRSAAEAAQAAGRELDRNAYAGCNLLCADADSVQAIHAGDWLRLRPLPPGTYVMGKGELNDGTDPRIAFALDWLLSRNYPLAEMWLPALKELCAMSGGTDSPPICLHGTHGGTVSSSLFLLRRPLVRSRYWHAQGSPDETPFEDYSHLFDELEP